MDYARQLVWETEGRRGAAERGWLGAEERKDEDRRQREEYEAYLDDQELYIGDGGRDRTS